MLQRHLARCLLRPSDLEPTQEDLQVIGAFNPGAIDIDGEVVLLARVAEAPAESRTGYTGLLRWDLSGDRPRIVTDWVSNEELEPIDARVVRTKAGVRRLTFTSHLRVVRLTEGGRALDRDALPGAGRLDPATPWETYGLEDPRIVRLDRTCYITYVAVSPHGAATALISTDDFRRFHRHGILFPPENKDVVLFPERIAGRCVALHRPTPHQLFAPPEIWIARSDDLVHWGQHEPFLGAGGRTAGAVGWNIARIGAGCPPVRTGRGWLEIYHGNDRRADALPEEVGSYCAAALLLDGEDPGRILSHSTEPIMRPEEDFEQIGGFVPNVVFPTGIIEREETYLVYYGAADTNVGVVEWSKADLLAALP